MAASPLRAEISAHDSDNNCVVYSVLGQLEKLGGPEVQREDCVEPVDEGEVEGR